MKHLPSSSAFYEYVSGEDVNLSLHVRYREGIQGVTFLWFRNFRSRLFEGICQDTTSQKVQRLWSHSLQPLGFTRMKVSNPTKDLRRPWSKSANNHSLCCVSRLLLTTTILSWRRRGFHLNLFATICMHQGWWPGIAGFPRMDQHRFDQLTQRLRICYLCEAVLFRPRRGRGYNAKLVASKPSSLSSNTTKFDQSAL